MAAKLALLTHLQRVAVMRLVGQSPKLLISALSLSPESHDFDVNRYTQGQRLDCRRHYKPEAQPGCRCSRAGFFWQRGLIQRRFLGEPST